MGQTSRFVLSWFLHISSVRTAGGARGAVHQMAEGLGPTAGKGDDEGRGLRRDDQAAEQTACCHVVGVGGRVSHLTGYRESEETGEGEGPTAS
eukprot:643860-Hanusia_phi.AAC.2